MSGSVSLTDFIIKGEKTVNYYNAVKSVQVLIPLQFKTLNVFTVS